MTLSSQHKNALLLWWKKEELYRCCRAFGVTAICFYFIAIVGGAILQFSLWRPFSSFFSSLSIFLDIQFMFFAIVSTFIFALTVVAQWFTLSTQPITVKPRMSKILFVVARRSTILYFVLNVLFSYFAMDYFLRGTERRNTTASKCDRLFVGLVWICFAILDSLKYFAFDQYLVRICNKRIRSVFGALNDLFVQRWRVELFNFLLFVTVPLILMIAAVVLSMSTFAGNIFGDRWTKDVILSRFLDSFRPYNLAFALISTLILFINSKISRFVLHFYIGQHYDFRLPLSTDLQDDLGPHLISALYVDDECLLLKYLAFLDLWQLSSVSSAKRRAVFSLSVPGGHPRNWSAIFTESARLLCGLSGDCKKLNQTLRRKYLARSVLPTHGRSHAFDQSTSLLLPPQYRRYMSLHARKDHGAALDDTTASAESEVADVFSTSRFSLDATIPGSARFTTQQQGSFLLILTESMRRFFKSNQLLAYLFFVDPYQEISEVLRDAVLHERNIEALTNLACASRQEDSYGVVQRNLPALIGYLLEFYAAIDETCRLKRTLVGAGGCGEETELLRIANCSLRSLRGAFGNCFDSLSFSKEQQVTLLAWKSRCEA